MARVAFWTAVVTVALLGFNGTGRKRAARENVEGGRECPDEHRDRSADPPDDTPVLGWKDILLRVKANIAQHRLIAIAAGVTFYVVLAIFPALAALVSLYGLFADASAIENHLSQLATLVPGGAIDVIGDQITRIASQPPSTLGFAFAFSLAIALWSANGGIKALFDSLNVVYQEKESRGFFALNATSLLFTCAAILFGLVALAAVVVVPAVMKRIGLGEIADTLVRIGRWPVLLVLVGVALGIVYRYGPNRSRPKWRWISWGSAFAAVGWLAISILFSWCAAHFGSYNKTYGSLGAIIGFMTWIWLSTIVILIGAEIDAEMERQTARDTTAGPPRPLGSRGAGAI